MIKTLSLILCCITLPLLAQESAAQQPPAAAENTGANASILRAASGSIIPGIFSLWLLFLLLGLSSFYAT